MHFKTNVYSKFDGLLLNKALKNFLIYEQHLLIQSIDF